MVVSFKNDGSGIQWALASDASVFASSDAASSVSTNRTYPIYTFRDGDRAKFWEPHAVVSWQADEFYLIDDGKSRTNCTSIETCYSRAVGYKIDHNKDEVKLIWEFEYPLGPNSGATAEEAADLFNFDGGYVSKLGENSYLVALTAIQLADDDEEGHPAYVFEADANGKARTKIRFPRTPISHKSGSYRAEATSTVFGETRNAPW